MFYMLQIKFTTAHREMYHEDAFEEGVHDSEPISTLCEIVNQKHITHKHYITPTALISFALT